MSQQQGVEEPPPAPLPAAEGEAQPAADIPMSEAAEVEDEEEEPVVGEGEDGADGAADAVDSVNASAKPEAEGAEEEGGSDRKERNGGPTADLVGEVVKLENGDGPVTVGGSVDEGRGGDGGDDKGLAGQNQPAVNQLLLAPAEEDLALSKISDNSFMFDYTTGGDDSGTEEEQAAFMKELERFHREKMLEFKPPKFYGEGLNCLKLWRQVTGLGGYDQALLEYEKHKIETGEFQVASSALPDRFGSESQVGGSHVSGSGRARRESATRAMQGWHSQRLLGNGEIADPIIKDKGHIVLKKDKTPKSSGTFLHYKDCYEVYALVPGLLREEVHVQSDPAGRLIVTGEPEQLDNPWGVTPFKKVISLPSRIDPHQTSAVVTLHGQLFVRAPFEQSK
ncbi:AT-rich interactive domain-containing protein 3 [Zea mays]|uniref:AT-rich interactive domain-containing protein 3 n=1 Tax=Zea mays TaxID=4577 RepID=A0A1D6LR71_MAIZE|nr:AT-rich interactive domain-containing protein 3 [Zea mays]